ncbi:MAG: hypothetical protein ACYTFG_19030, partial [Planctomycetota bacterium]
MTQELLQKVNEEGLDLYKVMQAAARMHALDGTGIIADRLHAVLEECRADTTARILTEEPQAQTLEETVEETEPTVKACSPDEAAEFAGNMDFPLSPIDWNARRSKYETVLGQRLPSAEKLTEQYSTWEEFWKAAGFSIELPSPKEVIDLTVETQNVGFLARKHFDAQFPELPSSSYVLKVFGGEWKTYSEAVARVRKKQRLPIQRIDELLEEGRPVKEVQRTVVAEFGHQTDIAERYKRADNTLYKEIARRKEQVEEHLESKRLTRGKIIHQYSSLEAIANTKINGFRLYNGSRKAEKRDQMAEDVYEHLIPTSGSLGRFSYLGLE